jgi:hypothetical protein
VDNRVSGGTMQEAATATCSHCHAIVVLNPDRTRERGYCRGCNSYLCDACNAVKAQTLQCRTMDQVIDEVLTAAEAGREPKPNLLRS